MVEPVAVEPRRGRSCWLIGCMVLIVLAVVPVATVWAILNVAKNAGPVEPRHEDVAHPLPAGSGTVVLHLAMAEVAVEPAPAGSPLRLVADWDASAFTLQETMRPHAGGWTYEVTFRGHGLGILGHRHERDENKLRLYLPAGAPVAIEGKLGMGEADMALGGLAVRRLDLALGMGEHRVSFATPTTVPLDLLRLRGSMGDLTVLRAGNASPRAVEIRHGMGDLTLDLAGAWRNDADVTLRLGMGSSQVQLPSPSEATAEVARAHVGLGDRAVHGQRAAAGAPGLPHLRIRATGGLGELEIR